jgi:hypothetical protein
MTALNVGVRREDLLELCEPRGVHLRERCLEDS